MAGKKNDIWLPFYLGDYLKDTMHLSTIEHGAYFLLILAYWNNQGPLEDDDSQLSRIVRASLSDWSAIRSVVAKFFAVSNGVWSHGRIEKEILKAKSQKEAKKRGAEATNRKRWSHSDTVSDSHSDTLSGSQNGRSSPSPSPSPSYTERGTEVPTLEQAVKDAQNQTQPHLIPNADFIKFVYQDWSSRYGKDAGGILVDWRKYVAKRWDRECEQWKNGNHKGKTKPTNGKTNGTRAPFLSELKLQKDAVLEQIRLAPANYNGARPANNPTPEQEAELKSYRAKEKELSKAIANFS